MGDKVGLFGPLLRRRLSYAEVVRLPLQHVCALTKLRPEAVKAELPPPRKSGANGTDYWRLSDVLDWWAEKRKSAT